MQVMDVVEGLALTAENIDVVLEEIRPYLGGTGGGELELEGIEGPVVKIHIGGPAADVMTVRVAVTQKLRERCASWRLLLLHIIRITHELLMNDAEYRQLLRSNWCSNDETSETVLVFERGCE